MQIIQSYNTVYEDFEPPFRPFVSLENFLKGVKIELAELKLFKPKSYLPQKNKLKATKKLKTNAKINIKKADDRSSTVIMHQEDKIQRAS